MVEGVFHILRNAFRSKEASKGAVIFLLRWEKGKDSAGCEW